MFLPFHILSYVFTVVCFSSITDTVCELQRMIEWLHLKYFVKFTFLDCSCFINISKEFLHLLLHFLPTTMTLIWYQLLNNLLTLKHGPAVVVIILQCCAAARLRHADVACSGAAHHAVWRGQILKSRWIFRCFFKCWSQYYLNRRPAWFNS